MPNRRDDIVDRIEEEIRSYEAQANVRPFRGFIEEPLPKLDCTRIVDGYERAQLSAENAIRRIFASTLPARAGFEAGHPEAVRLERFFCKVRLEWIQADNLEILDMLEWAQQNGVTQAYLFIQRLADELKNAKRRAHGLRFNEFRTALVTNWMRYGFWLMSDDLIARVATTLKFRRKGCNRQTISKVVKDLKLEKHRQSARRPIIIGWEEKDRFVFRKGWSSES